MEKRTVRYPVGIQSFEKLRLAGMAYVDKTRFIPSLAATNGCVFLSRPRRFGKSLFLSTLKSYFLGRKDLFEGLDICREEHEWKRYPLVHIDLSGCEYTSAADLEQYLLNVIEGYEDEYHVPHHTSASGAGERFGKLIENIRRETGECVVLLVDEYDKPLLDTFSMPEVHKEMLRKLRVFYAQFKIRDEHIRFAMLTGVTRMGRMTIFSGLNNLDDITFDPQYNDICGLTETEMIDNFSPGIDKLSETLKKDPLHIMQMLDDRYRGYRFSLGGSQLYNPFSILNVLSKCRFGNYWFSSGTPRILVDVMQSTCYDISRLTDTPVTVDDLSNLFTAENPLPLFFQSGYLTIGLDLYDDPDLFNLEFPNKEVKEGLLKYLMPFYLNCKEGDQNGIIRRLTDALFDARPEDFMQEMKVLLASIPYHLCRRHDESYYHSLFYLTAQIIGLKSRCEVAMANGRIDMTVRCSDIMYIFEFKTDADADTAIRQIQTREYSLPYLRECARIFRIGANFSTKTNTLSDWIIERER